MHHYYYTMVVLLLLTISTTPLQAPPTKDVSKDAKGEEQAPTKFTTKELFTMPARIGAIIRPIYQGKSKPLTRGDFVCVEMCGKHVIGVVLVTRSSTTCKGNVVDVQLNEADVVTVLPERLERFIPLPLTCRK